VRDQNRAGRTELLQTPYSKFERNIREQLGRMLGGAGFDPARDIEGITVNRWAHGYAFTPFGLDLPQWKTGQEPWVLGRKPFGRIGSPIPMRVRALTLMWQSIRRFAR